jgi:hypothetical protein
VTQQTPNTGFEQRLLTQLRSVVAERGAAQEQMAKAASPTPSWRRTPRLALGGAVAAVAVAAAMIVSAGGDNTQAAFAVEPQAGGGVNLKIYSLSDADGLEGALEEAGIPADVTYLPAGTTCRDRNLQPSTLNIPGETGDYPVSDFDFRGASAPMTIGIVNEQQRHEVLDQMQQGELPTTAGPNFFLNPDWFQSNQTLVLTGSPTASDGGASVARVQIAAGPVAPCDPVPAT